MNDFNTLINERLYLFDFEVTQYDWLLVIHKYSDNSETIFHNAANDEVYEFINRNCPILLGHNARYYDCYILKAILSGFDITEIKAVNDHIIQGGQGFELQYEYIDNFPPIWDTIQDVVPPKSLKEIEACLLLDITESTISFNIDHQWTTQEYEEMLYYCRHDVDALRPLFEARKSYFKTKYDLCILSGIDPALNIGLTNAKLCAKFLEAKQVTRNDEREYTIPKSIDTDIIEKEVLNFFNTIHDKTISSEELFKTKLEYNSHGMPCVVSWGGKHGALPNFYYDSREEPNMVVINEDFASLYPHLLALPQYNFISRNIKDKNAYYNTLKHRLELKKQGKKEEQLPLKLILNTTYGCQNNRYNDLFDPKGARGTCITGQLLISELTEKIYAIGDVTLIQLNTDGLMVKIPKNKLSEYYKVSDEFSKKCGIDLEYDIIDKIIQRDVNNYIMIYGDEKHKSIKAKGGCFASLPKLEIEENGAISSVYEPNFKANSLAIVSEALAKYLLFNVSIEETINNETNIHKFQMVQHLGSTYEKCIQESPNGDTLLQRNNRIYAGLKPSGTIIKVKPNGRRDSLANCPPNPIVDNDNHLTINDINKHWYIQLAQQWANDFKGIKRLAEYKKIELIEIAEDMGIKFDPKIKKDELIKLIENSKNENNMLQKEAKEDINTNNVYNYQVPNNNLSNNKIKDLTGFVNGKLTVIRFIKTINGKSYWECKCDCGKIFIRRSDAIKSNKINGCLQCSHRFSDRKKNSQGDSVKSGKYYRLYRIWKGMKDRCYLQSSKHFDRYGGRGIKICKEWKSNYVVFKEWALQNGYNDTLSIERKNIDKDYEPSNCCWIPLSMQNKNTSRTWRIKYKNVTYTLGDLSEYLHIPRTTLRRYLLKNDMNIDKCIKNYNERTIRNAKKRY